MTENEVRYTVKVGKIPKGAGVDAWGRPFWTEEVEGHAPRNRPYRTKPPIHPQMLAKMVGHAAWTISMAFEKTGAEADAEWTRLAKLFYHQGKDPNWRCRPSILDQIRGWKIRPGKPRSAKRRVASGGLK